MAPRGAVVVRDATFAGPRGLARGARRARARDGRAQRRDERRPDPPAARLPDGAAREPGQPHGRAPAGERRQRDGHARRAATAPGTTTTDRGAGDGFGSVFERAADGQGVLLLLLLAAFGWGAVHALSPGHGKAMVAAYLVGTRGTARHAVALGLTVTVTHTIGVFALGAVALALSAYVLPEDLYPWLNLVSGLLVLGVGGVGRARARARARATPAHAHHHHDHDHDHDHGHDHGHGHGHHHHDHADLRPRALLAMGASAGLIPCPSALVVLLGAVAQHQIGLGMVLIVAFSAGLAATLTGLGPARRARRGASRRA